MQTYGQIVFNNQNKIEDRKKIKDKIISNAIKSSNKNPKPTDPLAPIAAVAENPLIKIRTHAPLDPFPNQLIVDINKVDLIVNQFLSSSYTNTITVKNLAKVDLENGPLHSKLVIKPKLNTQPSIEASFLKKDQAGEAKAIIQGLIIAEDKRIDLEEIPIEKLKDELTKIGSI